MGELNNLEENRLYNITKKLQDREAHVLDHQFYFKSAVMVPLIKKEDGLYILFEVRSEHLRRQPGEICFPGGRVDKEDKTPLHTAIRETCEELGVTPGHIKPLAALDFLPSSGSIIYPYVGTLKNEGDIEANPEEVAEVFYVPLDFFLKTTPERYDLHIQLQPEEGFPFHLISNGKDYNWRTGIIPEYFYTYNNYVIWGLTARIIYHFISLIKDVGQ
jgi:coenzyme A diphosphatase NUDT7